MSEPRIVPCDHCGSEGRLYSGHANDPDPRDDGPCPACEGTGGEIIETDPVTLDDMCCSDCGALINPLRYPCHEKTCPQHPDNYEPPDPPGWEGGFAENH